MTPQDHIKLSVCQSVCQFMKFKFIELLTQLKAYLSKNCLKHSMTMGDPFQTILSPLVFRYRNNCQMDICSWIHLNEVGGMTSLWWGRMSSL